MTTLKTGGLDKMSNLHAELCRLDTPHGESSSSELRQARQGLIEAIRGDRASRYHLGRALRTYKVQFKAEHRWMAAAKVIADAIDCDEKTVFRIIEDFERAEGLPAITIQAMLDQKIDPAARKYANVVEQLRNLPVPETREQAAKVVTSTLESHRARKKSQESPEQQIPLQEFAARIARLFKKRYRAASAPEKQNDLGSVFEMVARELGVSIEIIEKPSHPVEARKEVAA